MAARQPGGAQNGTGTRPGRSRRRWLAAVALFVFADALTLQTRGALLASFRSSFDLSAGLLGLVAPAGTVGFVVAVLGVGLRTGRLDLKRGLVVGVAATAACLAVMSVAPTYWVFLLVLLGQGTATGVVRAVDRPILSHLYPTRRGQVFTLHALAWGAGAVAGPLVVNAVLARGDWRATYALLALLVAPLALLLWRVDLPADAAGERVISLAALRRLLRRPVVVGMASAMVLVGAIEGSVFTWLPFYGAGFVPHQRANLLLSTFLLAYLPGRLAYSWLAERIGYLSLALALSAAALAPLALLFAGTGWLPVAPTAPQLFAFAFLAGLFVCGFFPLVSAVGVDAAPEYSGPVSAIATASTYLGIAIGPVIVGLLAERTSIAAAMGLPVVLAVCLVVVLAVTHATTRRGGDGGM